MTVSLPAPAPVPRPEASGWYADPWRLNRLRFFDGEQWTERARQRSALVIGLVATGAGLLAVVIGTGLFFVGYGAAENSDTFGLASLGALIGFSGLVGIVVGVMTLLVASVYRLADHSRAHHAGAVDPITDAPPAAWLVDPAGRYAYRYWDGARWTADVSTVGTRDTDPVTESYLPPPPEFVASRAMTLASCSLVGAGVVIGALGLWGWTAELHRVGGESWEAVGSILAVLIAMGLIACGAVGAIIGAVRRHRARDVVSDGSR